jgi:hypothetical protein
MSSIFGSPHEWQLHPQASHDKNYTSHRCWHSQNAPLTAVDLVRMIEEEQTKLGGRLTDYLPADRVENSK